MRIQYSVDKKDVKNVSKFLMKKDKKLKATVNQYKRTLKSTVSTLLIFLIVMLSIDIIYALSNVDNYDLTTILENDLVSLILEMVKLGGEYRITGIVCIVFIIGVMVFIFYRDDSGTIARKKQYLKAVVKNNINFNSFSMDEEGLWVERDDTIKKMPWSNIKEIIFDMNILYFFNNDDKLEAVIPFNSVEEPEKMLLNNIENISKIKIAME